MSELDRMNQNNEREYEMDMEILAEIAKEKSTDMNCFGDINAAVKILEGSARSMGIKVVD